MIKRRHSILSVLLILALTILFLPVNVSAKDDTETFDTAEWYSTFASGQELLQDGVYFSDEWFAQDPAAENKALALSSMQLVAAALDETEDNKGEAMLKTLGFEAAGTVNVGTENPGDCSYTWGTKTVSAGGETFTIAAVVIHSYTFTDSTKRKGWMQNFCVNGEEETAEHYALAKAADSITDTVNSLSDGNTVFWVMGQSRGGAIANLLSVRLHNSNTAKRIYTYAFEAPAVVNVDAAGDYTFIHNYYCDDDPVVMIPPWDMTVYGQRHLLNTEEADAKLAQELEKLESTGLEILEEEPGIDVRQTEENLIAALTEKVPTRADYSKVNTVTVTKEDGQETELTFTYQDTFIHLLDVMYSSDLSGFSADEAIERMDELLNPAEALSNAVKNDSADDYYIAACGVKSFMTNIGLNVDLSEKDLYVLLTLIGSQIVDTSYEPDEDGPSVMMYMLPLVELYSNVNHIVFSHHFDAIIARLKALAPYPQVSSLSVTITEPKAGDGTDAAPAEVISAISTPGSDWSDVSAKWLDVQDTLEEGCIYYLQVTLQTTAHTVPEDFAFLINGKQPSEEMQITYEKGIYTVQALFEFTLGTPEKVTIHFDSKGHGKTIDDITVNKGILLRTAMEVEDQGIITDDEGTWRFESWLDEDGRDWRDVIAAGDLTLYASWTELLTAIKVQYTIPNVGEPLGMPESAEPDKYIFEEIEFTDSDYNYVDTALSADWYSVCFHAVIVADHTEFYVTENEYGDDYAGTLIINGEEVAINTYEEHAASANTDEGYIRVQFDFLPLEASYDVIEGAQSTYVKGSGSSVTLRIRRSINDERCYELFREVLIDGKVLDTKLYEAKPGSTIITLKSSTLDALSAGSHTVTVNFADGQAKTTVQIKEDPGTKAPDTSDHTNMTLWTGMLAASLLVFLSALYCRRRMS